MKAKKLIGAVAIAAALVVLPVTAAGATTEYVGGGLWTYGTTLDTVYSNYHHQTKYHTATACHGGFFDQCRQAAATPGAWANAVHAKTWIGGNTAYWNTY